MEHFAPLDGTSAKGGPTRDKCLAQREKLQADVYKIGMDMCDRLHTWVGARIAQFNRTGK